MGVGPIRKKEKKMKSIINKAIVEIARVIATAILAMLGLTSTGCVADHSGVFCLINNNTAEEVSR